MTDTRHLDRLLAAHLMGQWRLWRNGGETYVYHKDGSNSILPRYSSTWAGMRRVVEAIIRDDWEVSLEYSAYWQQGQADTGWKAVLRCIRGQRQVVPAYAPTAPEAVARAALSALGVEVEG